MAPVPKAGVRRPDHLHVRVVDEGRGLEGVIGPLAAEEAAGQGPQLFIDEPEQLVRGRAVAAGDSLEDPGDIGLRHLAPKSQ